MRQNPDNRNIGRDDSLPIKFYYDFKSPFTFLAFDPAVDLDLTHRVRLRFIPHLFDFQDYGGALEVRNERDWRKVRYLYRAVRRFASERGIIIRGPQTLFDSAPRADRAASTPIAQRQSFANMRAPVWELRFSGAVNSTSNSSSSSPR